jgi:hypothetical protein
MRYPQNSDVWFQASNSYSAYFLFRYGEIPNPISMDSRRGLPLLLRRFLQSAIRSCHLLTVESVTVLYKNRIKDSAYSEDHDRPSAYFVAETV